MDIIEPTEANTTNAWRYSEGMPVDRKAWLAAPGSFAGMAAAAVAAASAPHLRAKPGREGPCVGHWQPIFSFTVPRVVGDALFNGPYGLRAQYWRSPACGLAANAALVQLLVASGRHNRAHSGA
ncbi:hypothetical protein [Variovorax saccharolyticus]|uniref:hypothetical protein n=1 Tax=Variovorax saccharolyticus TaxID=3053516 RepID=UPI002577CB95|nr:hypothetical protein [Variovorax sp. J22R187]MDM0022105.1 hypothetical protein [Variovorax sp. J22R187]